jgi:hypothetical protein
LWLEYNPSVNKQLKSYYIKKVRNSKSGQRQNWMTVSKNGVS